MRQLKNSELSLKGRKKSFKDAINGLVLMFQTEANAKIHLCLTILVSIFGIIFQLEIIEWVLVSAAIGLVILSELFNTALERLSDIISPEFHQGIRKVKDLAAAAVLVAATFSLITGFLIFLPKILKLF